MLSRELCRQLWDRLPAFRDHDPVSGDWYFPPDRDTPVPMLWDRDQSRAWVQRDDDQPGVVIHRDTPHAFAWCPRLDQLLALAMGTRPPDAVWTLEGRAATGVWVCRMVHQGRARSAAGDTPDEAVARWLLTWAQEQEA